MVVSFGHHLFLIHPRHLSVAHLGQSRVSAEKVSAKNTELLSVRRRVRWIVAVATVSVVLAMTVFGRDLFGIWARQCATRQMNAWAVSNALQWLEKADRFDPNNGETQLLKASCYRYLNQEQLRSEALAAAKELGVDSQRIKNELTLGDIQTGTLGEEAESQLPELSEAGLSPHDIAAAFIDGCIARQDMERATALLQAWAADYPNHVHNRYMHGVYLWHSNDQTGARKEFEQVLALEPRHELAQIALAKLNDEENQLNEALKCYVQLAGHNPNNENVIIGLAGVLRKTGRLDAARAVMEPLLARPETSSSVARAMGRLELEAADYERAIEWFELVSAHDMTDHATLSAVGVATAILGETTLAERAFQWIADEVSAVTLMHDLQIRLDRGRWR
jgi:Flp pilus assembly protein TadD